MKVLHTIEAYRAWRKNIPVELVAPFVPTMGALHEGHASLVRQARALADRPPAPAKAVIASIFVNPTQFGPQEDFAKYPRTLAADCAVLEAAGCDAVFVPSGAEMYPSGQSVAAAASVGSGNLPNAASQNALLTTVDPGPMGDILAGAPVGGRPGHFRGVCTVVAKLLLITQPTHLLLGQKDFQQQAILRRMCADLNFPLEVVTCPTLRESDGLAMSSRNRYLSPEERARAPALFEALALAKTHIDRGERSAAVLDAAMHTHLTHRGLFPQYALTADAQTLTPFRDLPQQSIVAPAVLLIAARLGTTRLIDNMLL
jgi:pantoate--beta-alanine ligase